MKSSIKKMSALLTMMAVAILTFTFTACSDDDDPVTEVTYTYGFSSMSASHRLSRRDGENRERLPVSPRYHRQALHQERYDRRM